MRDDKVKLTAVFTRDEAAVIKAMACKDDRTVSNFIRKIIVDNLLEEKHAVEIQAAQ